MSQLLEESEALRPQPEEQPVLAAESVEPLDLSFVEELRREPSDRDRRIHAEIDGEQRDPADVAAEFDLAEGTVRNIVQRVRRWKLELHDLIDMSSLDMLLVHYDQLKWQSRQLRLAWEYSAATREFVDKTISTRPGDPDQRHEREQIRRVASRGPNERYMRLHDHVREKMLKVGREVQELKVRTAVVAGSPDLRVVAGSPDPATAPPWSPTTPTPQAAKGARSETAARACCGQETAAERERVHGVAGSPDPATAPLWSPTTPTPQAAKGARSETAARACCGRETAAERGQETAAEPARHARPRSLSLRALAEIRAKFGIATPEAKEMPPESSSVPTVTRKKSKHERRLSKREKRLLKQSKYVRKAEPARAAGDTTGHSQQHVMAAPQAAAGAAVAPSQVG